MSDTQAEHCTHTQMHVCLGEIIAKDQTNQDFVDAKLYFSTELHIGLPLYQDPLNMFSENLSNAKVAS